MSIIKPEPAEPPPDAVPDTETKGDDPVFEMRSLRVSALRATMPVVLAILAAGLVANLLAPQDAQNAVGIPTGFVLVALAIWRSLRLYLRIDPAGVHVENFLETDDVPWNEIREITASQSFGVFSSTVAFRLHGQTGFLHKMPNAQVATNIAAKSKKRALLEILDHYSTKHAIPCYLNLDKTGSGWYVPTDALGERVPRAQLDTAEPG